jgi:hypothetical protein
LGIRYLVSKILSDFFAFQLYSVFVISDDHVTCPP